MHSRPTRIFLVVLFSTLIVFFIEGCGSGGGSGGGGGAETGARTVRPYILASLISFPAGAVPPGLVNTGFNSIATVEVLDNSSGASLSNASITLNGVALSYVPDNQDYEGEILVAPAA